MISYDVSDADLMSQDDPESFGEVYRRHAVAVLSWAYRRTFDAHLAADVTAETFARALVSRHRYRPESDSALPWLLGIAKNLLRTYHRRRRIEDSARRRLGMPIRDLDSESHARIDEIVDAERWRARLGEALAAIPRSGRAAVELRVLGDLPYAEVADRLGCSENAARVRVSRALSRLATILEESE